MNEINEQINVNVQYGIAKWMEENALSITNSLETQIATDFIKDLKKVCEMHNISIPEGKGDLVEEMAEEIDNLKEKLDKEIETNSKMKKDLEDKDKKDTVDKVSEGLSEVQKENDKY